MKLPDELVTMLNEAWWKLPRRVRNKMLNVPGEYDWNDYCSTPKKGLKKGPYWGHLHTFYDREFRRDMAKMKTQREQNRKYSDDTWTAAGKWRPPENSWDNAHSD